MHDAHSRKYGPVLASCKVVSFSEHLKCHCLKCFATVSCSEKSQFGMPKSDFCVMSLKNVFLQKGVLNQFSSDIFLSSYFTAVLGNPIFNHAWTMQLWLHHHI